MASPSDFEKWYESLGVDLGDVWDEVETERRQKFLGRRLRNLYEDQGPLAKDLVYASFLLDQIQLATDNVAVVLGDIERTTNLRPDIVVDNYDGAIRVAFNESYTTPSLWAWENPDALAEVADYLQEHVIERNCGRFGRRARSMDLVSLRRSTARSQLGGADTATTRWHPLDNSAYLIRRR